MNRITALIIGASAGLVGILRSPETEGGAGIPERDVSLTYGQWVVGTTFNPSANPDVDKIKAATAAIIDDLYKVSQDRNHPGARVASIAITQFEGAAMFGVKAYTKQPWA